MKRFVFILLLLVSAITLVGCNNKADYGKDINNIIAAYSESLNGSVKFEQGEENNLTVTELIYSYKLDGDKKTIKGLMSKQTEGSEERSIYVKDNVAYMLLDGQKTKSTLTEAEHKVTIEEYGFDAFIENIKAIYDEEFFKAVKVVSTDKAKTVLELDLSKYAGEINKSGNITKFEVVLHYDGKTITQIENKIVKSGVNNLIRVTFNSTKEPQINYPADLSTYK